MQALFIQLLDGTRQGLAKKGEKSGKPSSSPESDNRETGAVNLVVICLCGSIVMLSILSV